MNKKRVRTSEDVLEKFNNQIEFLKSSITAFDKGSESEAQRLAASLRILLLDKNQNHSLLSQVGLKEKMNFQSTTADYLAANLMTYNGLLGLRIESGKGGSYIINEIAEDNKGVKWLCFEDWWNELVIDDKTHFFSRKDLILIIADKEGGAHVDPTISEEYAHLINENSLGWTYGDGINANPFNNNPAYVSIRMIATEILNSIEMQLNYKYSRKTITKDFFAMFLDEDARKYRYFIPDFSKHTSDLRDVIIKGHEDTRVEKKEKRILFHEKIYMKDGSIRYRNILILS